MRTFLTGLIVSGIAIPITTFGASFADFEDLILAPNSHENGANLNPPGVFYSDGNAFNNTYSPDFGGFWGGFAYSNKTDNTTPGFGNQYSSFAGGGSDVLGATVVGGIYAVSYYDPFGFSVIPSITFNPGEVPVSLRVTNTTYAALSMRDGDGFSEKFGGVSGDDPDYFRLTISGFATGHVPTGTVDFYLADFRPSNNNDDYILDEWASVDLTALGAGTEMIEFSITATDSGTPTYFAVENVQTVPEPASLSFLIFGGAAALLRRRRSLCGKP